jgi:hypothetical protein
MPICTRDRAGMTPWHGKLRGALRVRVALTLATRGIIVGAPTALAMTPTSPLARPRPSPLAYPAPTAARGSSLLTQPGSRGGQAADVHA